MTKNTKILLGVLIGVTFLLTVGFTYAYFYLSVTGNDDATSIEVGATTLSLTYGDTLVLSGTNIEPGWEQTKTITIKNTGTEGIAYNIGWQQIFNQIKSGELYIEGTCSTSVKGSTCDSISSQAIPSYSSTQTAASGSIVYALKEGIYIDVGETHTYTIKVKFEDTSSLQNYNQGKTFSGTLGIVASGATTTVSVNVYNGNSSVKTGVSGTIYSNPINGTLTDGKLVFNNVPVGNHTLSITVGSNTYTKKVAVGLSTTNESSSVESGARIKVTATDDGVEIDAVISNNSISSVDITPTGSSNPKLYSLIAAQTLGTGSTLNSGAGINYASASSSTNGRGVYTYTHDSAPGSIDSAGGTQTIYYYRGNVTNNNVLFAGYCWLIVRTTDTGGVKLLYNGTPVNDTCPSYRTTESTVPLNNTSSVWNDTTYSVLYGESTVKTIIDSWISTNLTNTSDSSKNFSSMLEKINWCNDADGQQYSIDTLIEYPGYERYNNATPQLECASESDAYSLYGALLTIDEAMFAGLAQPKDNTNFDSYLNVYKKTWWLLSPDFINDGGRVFYSNGEKCRVVSNPASNSHGVRISISLSPSVGVSGGDGSASTPYELE